MAASTAPMSPVTLLPADGDAIGVVAKFFRALGDPARLRLLEFLLHDEHTVTQCVQHITDTTATHD
jgi:hypothetical protein